jgi:hypothetical protein
VFSNRLAVVNARIDKGGKRHDQGLSRPPSWYQRRRQNKVPMAELKACFEELGCENVRTYIASGNVLFESNMSSAELTEEIQKALPAKFRLDSELIRI